MKILRGSITALAREGRVSLQVPELQLGGPVVFEEAPDAWFVRLSNGVPSPRGFLFLSKAGWRANRAKLREAFGASQTNQRRAMSWADFEAQIREELSTREAKTDKAIKAARAKLYKLLVAAELLR